MSEPEPTGTPKRNQGAALLAVGGGLIACGGALSATHVAGGLAGWGLLGAGAALAIAGVAMLRRAHRGGGA